jgi:hypothetical protein
VAASLEPAELAQARKIATARARSAAATLTPSLARKALAQANAEANRTR